MFMCLMFVLLSFLLCAGLDKIAVTLIFFPCEEAVAVPVAAAVAEAEVEAAALFGFVAVTVVFFLVL